ncbi:MAG TPA: DUF899 family protein [Blastocatellia bacterium]|nr:DUF899 family protein [Blastocatellia bacterium]
MPHETNQDTFRQTNLPNESDDYLSKREELRLAEIELMRHRERVAELRRQLPEGATVQDYVFEEGPADLNAGDAPIRTVRLSELVTAPDRSLVIYHFMYGKKQTNPCPMCTMWIDGFNGVAHHLAQNVDVAIVAAADPTALRAHARKRSWDRLRLLSCGANTFKYDLRSEDREGNQDSTVSVFTRDTDGTLRHFYSAHPSMADDIRERGIDLLTPVYNILDLTPQGRGNWYAALGYGTKVQVARL